jgi:uncharacterized metal-binding protein YceD (DUF177 family)
MHINVRDFLAESIGFSRAYKIAGERPALATVVLTHDITGEVTVARLDEAKLRVEGHLSTEVQLECHRCLRTFTRPVSVNFRQIYAEAPRDDELPVVKSEIDLAPLMEQEIILSLPIKILHSPDCPGIKGVSEQFTDDEPPGTRLGDRAHITKGK